MFLIPHETEKKRKFNVMRQNEATAAAAAATTDTDTNTDTNIRHPPQELF